jgi:hypothetical protein
MATILGLIEFGSDGIKCRGTAGVSSDFKCPWEG